MEVFGPYAITAGVGFYSITISRLTSGYIYHYAFFIILGISCLLLLNIFSADTINFEFFFLQFFFFAIFFFNFKSLNVLS